MLMELEVLDFSHNSIMKIDDDTLAGAAKIISGNTAIPARTSFNTRLLVATACGTAQSANAQNPSSVAPIAVPCHIALTLRF